MLAYLALQIYGLACLSHLPFTHSSSAVVAIFIDCKMWLNWGNNSNVFRLCARVVLPFSLASLARPVDGFPVFWPVSQDSAKESEPVLQNVACCSALGP